MEQNFYLYKMEPPDSRGLVGDLHRDVDVQFSESLMETAVYHRWCSIGAKHHLPTHFDILCFLIKCYDEMFGQSGCLTCLSPLAVVCVKCLMQSHSAAGDNSQTHPSWPAASDADPRKTESAPALANQQHQLPYLHHQQQQQLPSQEDVTLSAPCIPPSLDIPGDPDYSKSNHSAPAPSLAHQSCSVTPVSLPSSVPLTTSALRDQSTANSSSLVHSACEELRHKHSFHPQLPSFPATSLVTSFPVNSPLPVNSACAAIPQTVFAPGMSKCKTEQESSLVVSPESSLEPTVFGAEAAMHCLPAAHRLKRAQEASTPNRKSVEVQTQTKTSARGRLKQIPRRKVNTRSRTVKRTRAKSKSGPVKYEPARDDTDNGTWSTNSIPSHGDSDASTYSQTDLVQNIRTADLSGDLSPVNKRRKIKVEMEAAAESLTPEVREEREKVPESLYCAKCNKKYSCRLTLKRHLELSRAHGGPGNIIIPKHRQGEQSRKRPKRSLEEYFHYWWTHGDVDVVDDSVVCKLCVHSTKLFSSKQEWRKHHREHKIRVKKTLCPVCGNEVDNLKIHMLYHRSDKPYKCPYCPAAHVIKQKLRDHIYTHTKEKNFCCEICGKRFSVKARLAAHSLVHSNKKPFKCEQCGDSFARNRGLKDHMRVHTGEKPYACGVCGRKFASSGNLAAHRRKVHRMEPMVGRTAKKLIVID